MLKTRGTGHLLQRPLVDSETFGHRGSMLYRRLGPEDAPQYRTLRISGLRESPAAFVSSADEEAGWPLEKSIARLQPRPGLATFGAWLDGELVGICTVKREERPRLMHKAHLVGVYVAPAARRLGAARELIRMALAYAASIGVRQINLGVNAANTPALRLYEGLGFRSFGLERNFMCVDGEFQDEINMVCELQPNDRSA